MQILALLNCVTHQGSVPHNLLRVTHPGCHFGCASSTVHEMLREAVTMDMANSGFVPTLFVSVARFQEQMHYEELINQLFLCYMCLPVNSEDCIKSTEIMAFVYGHTHTALTYLKKNCISHFNLFLRNLNFFLSNLKYHLRDCSQEVFYFCEILWREINWRILIPIYPPEKKQTDIYCNISANSEYSVFSKLQVSCLCGYLLFPTCNLSVKLYHWYFPSVTSKFNHKTSQLFRKAKHGEKPLPETWSGFPVLV